MPHLKAFIVVGFLLGVAMAGSCKKRESSSATKDADTDANAHRPEQLDLDPFRPSGSAAKMLTGQDKGQDIDVDWRRSGKLLTESQARKYFPNYRPGRELVIANVKHFDDWYIARIPLDGIKEVRVNRDIIIPAKGINHAGFRFIMHRDAKIDITAQVFKPSRPYTFEKAELTSLAFGIFATGAKGRQFGFNNSIRQNLTIAFQFMTPAEQASRAWKDDNSFPMFEMPLDRLAPGYARQLFEHIALTADRLGYSESYGMLMNNCVHKIFDLLNEALPANTAIGRGWQDLSQKVKDAIPTGVLNGREDVIASELRRQGFASSNANWIPIMETDLGEFMGVIWCPTRITPDNLRIRCMARFCKLNSEDFSACLQAKREQVDSCLATNQACIAGP